MAKKSPAVLFYCSDFLAGVAGWTNEEVGAYIILLCKQYEKGRLTEKDIRRSVDNHAEIWPDIQEKFIQDENGLWYNERMEEEQIKRNKFVESRRQARLGKKKKPSEEHTKIIRSSSEKRMGNGNGNGNEDGKGKGKGKRAKKFGGSKVDPSEYPFPSERFREVWLQWLVYKYEQFNFEYKSANSELIALNQLARASMIDGMADEFTSLQIIETSISNGWKGLVFDNKGGRTSSSERGAGSGFTPEGFTRIIKGS